jgi:hypothetical protein
VEIESESGGKRLRNRSFGFLPWGLAKDWTPPATSHRQTMTIYKTLSNAMTQTGLVRARLGRIMSQNGWTDWHIYRSNL